MINRYLLTGAGFTYNFGAPLSNQVWNLIFNHKILKPHKALKTLMLSSTKKFNFESIYTEILQNERYSQAEKAAITGILIETFRNIDEDIRLAIHQELKYEVSFAALIRFIESFAVNNSSCIFTLNQDLFLERLFLKEYKLPRLTALYTDLPLWDYKASKIIENQNFKFDSAKLETYKKYSNFGKPHNQKHLHYIKLHGSYKWVYNDGVIEYPLMAVGIDKKSSLTNPLLSAYFEIFKNSLHQPDTRLLIIGYSFRDNHINDIILSAIKNYSLRLHIIYPEPIEIFLMNLKKSIYRPGPALDFDHFRNAIEGYYPATLKEIFPFNNPYGHSRYFSMLISNFLENS